MFPLVTRGSRVGGVSAATQVGDQGATRSLGPGTDPRTLRPGSLWVPRCHIVACAASLQFASLISQYCSVWAAEAERKQVQQREHGRCLKVHSLLNLLERSDSKVKNICLHVSSHQVETCSLDIQPEDRRKIFGCISNATGMLI